MSDILIFGGTTEGRELAIAFDKMHIQTLYSVATEYGKEILPEFNFVKVQNKRLNADEVTDIIKNNKIQYVIDATHPYAFEISKNIKAAIENLSENIELLCIKREQVNYNNCIEFANSKEAAAFLFSTSGNILLTTGSKEIADFKKLAARVYPRVLPAVNSINACISAGISAKNIIAMQGPFSENLNKAIIMEFDCKYLVTKLSGKSGGFDEKIKAAKATGCVPIIILPQTAAVGISVQECVDIIGVKYGY